MPFRPQTEKEKKQHPEPCGSPEHRPPSHIESHKCAATPEQVKALVDIVKMAREYAGNYWLINPRDTRISDAEKVLKELGYE